ncbi:MAG TPA: nucleotidyltransferase domain-containing protein [Candidatus Binatus sp.]|uniref:nucleotidyltransferase domain-containing protein n=1 Tax=Candidatus Binatus sp. TaxID=2811406 RepID=UPI002B488BFB|nr:nucleotidyltransferase domain-containing protein [Candidatus Binatus sp.]HKN13149.1 nucleotidyltransferase domain-containing protein [Candidatus Binatus sp.]
MPTEHEVDQTLTQVVARVAKIDGVQAIVLGGSRARGTADERSDIDLGIYYDGKHPFSTVALEAAAKDLDDRHSEGLVTSFGEWGPGVNGGGWLEIQGNHIDFLYREIGAVREAIEDCVAGRPRSVHQLGHPLGFHMQIYAGEVHVCRPLFDPSGTVARLKSLVSEYPEKFRTAVIAKHLFDAEFEITIAAKAAARTDIMYVAGCLFRAAGFMTLVLYALNRRFFFNEKGAWAESRGFAIKPVRFHDTVATVLGSVGTTVAELAASAVSFQSLAAELRQLAARPAKASSSDCVL